MTVRIPLSRRRFLATAAASTAISAVVPKPYLSRAADRPVITLSLIHISEPTRPY